jgi:hypothetical protein
MELWLTEEKLRVPNLLTLSLSGIMGTTKIWTEASQTGLIWVNHGLSWNSTGTLHSTKLKPLTWCSVPDWAHLGQSWSQLKQQVHRYTGTGQQVHCTELNQYMKRLCINHITVGRMCLQKKTRCCGITMISDYVDYMSNSCHLMLSYQWLSAQVCFFLLSDNIILSDYLMLIW